MSAGIEERIRDLVRYVNMDSDDFDLFLPVNSQVVYFNKSKKILIFTYAGEWCRVDGDEKEISFLSRDEVEGFLEIEILEGISLENFARAVLIFPALWKLRKSAVIYDF
ncbi:MAG: hypothetical protein QXV17_11620 [Candidatus Micrarchaeaceae archaeon]